MKKRRTLIVSLLLVAALVLGIGYAALTDELTLTGKIKSDAQEMGSTFDGLVYFTNATVTNTPAVHITADVQATYGGDEASYSIHGMNTVGDVVTMSFTIHNDYEFPVWVTLVNNSPALTDCLKIEDNYDAPVMIEAKGGEDDYVFEVTITLEKLSSDGLDVDRNLTFTASDTDPSLGA